MSAEATVVPMNQSKNICVSDDLLYSCVQKDRKGQEQLYRLTYSPMMRIIRHYIYDQDQSLDILNKSMFKVLTKIDQYKGDGIHLFGWMKRIAINESLDHLRRNRQVITPIELMDYDNYPGDEVNPSHETTEEIVYLLKQLPQLTATVFSLYALDGYAHSEIAKELNISIANSKWHLHSARKRLQQIIGLQNDTEI
jgi:RNA polymerase sigma factor (sigma-70 family)